jgi:hypothetical protein
MKKLLHLSVLMTLTASLPLLSSLHAEQNQPLLLSPGSVLTGGATDGGALEVSVDGKPLSFENPVILFEQHLPEADFVSAAWKDGSGQLLHQRDVLLVKSGYCIVVDYLYGSGEHAVVRSFSFPKEGVELGPQSASAKLSDGKKGSSLLIQGLDPDSKIDQDKATGQILLSGSKKSPTPLPTLLATWSGTTAPKVESVKAGNPMVVKLNVTFADGRFDEVGLAWESRPLHLGNPKREFHGWAACFRHGPRGDSFFEVK